MDRSILYQSEGTFFPLGAYFFNNDAYFSVISSAAEISLVLFDENLQKTAIYDLDPFINKKGHLWHIKLSSIKEGTLYAWKIGSHLALDPYARATGRNEGWGKQKRANGEPKLRSHLGYLLKPAPFDWENIPPPQIEQKDLIIYEMHVRGFTISPDSGVKYPGTFSGIIEKIPHLVELGINAVEFLPVFAFNESELQKKFGKEQLYNYWGYSPYSFFSLMPPYGSSEKPEDLIFEWKTLVKELHRNGIAVILDVVFNHTGEGVFDEGNFSFSILDNKAYYNPSDFSGCGNTIRSESPVAIGLIIDSLRYFALEMGVDGFRFDLAAALSRTYAGSLSFPSALISAINEDPLLGNTLLIAEPWDAKGGYLLGQFAALHPRWTEWNDRYRDCVRRFLKGDKDKVKNEFATRISGSSDIFPKSSTGSSLNFITSHDGFTLHDLVSYNEKHNFNNKEHNTDGHNHNYSWNCGAEGPTKDIRVLFLRERQMRNFVLALAISQGPIMLHMGDEYGHTKKGNNNSWCHDSPINWFLWDELKKRGDLFRFFRGLLRLRKKYAIFRKGSFLTEKDIVWHGKKPNDPKWEDPDSFIALTLTDRETKTLFFAAFNAQHREETITLPKPPEGKTWRKLVDTSSPYPEDLFEEKSAPFHESDRFHLTSYSSCLLFC